MLVLTALSELKQGDYLTLYDCISRLRKQEISLNEAGRILNRAGLFYDDIHMIVRESQNEQYSHIYNNLNHYRNLLYTPPKVYNDIKIPQINNDTINSILNMDKYQINNETFIHNDFDITDSKYNKPSSTDGGF